MQYNKEFKAKPGRQISVSSPRDVRKRQAAKESDTRLIEELQRQIADLRNQFVAGTGGMTPERVDDEIRKAVKDAVKETKGYYEPLLVESKRREKELNIRVRELKNKLGASLIEEKDTHKKELKKALKDMESRYNKTISSLEDRLRLTEDKVVERETQLEELKAERDNTIKKMLGEHTKKLEELAKTISIEKLGVDDPDRPKIEDVFIDPLESGAGSDLEPHVEIEDISVDEKGDMKGKVDKLRDLIGSFAKEE